jgi:hypothetical protein
VLSLSLRYVPAMREGTISFVLSLSVCTLAWYVCVRASAGDANFLAKVNAQLFTDLRGTLSRDYVIELPIPYQYSTRSSYCSSSDSFASSVAVGDRCAEVTTPLGMRVSPRGFIHFAPLRVLAVGRDERTVWAQVPLPPRPSYPYQIT